MFWAREPRARKEPADEPLFRIPLEAAHDPKRVPYDPAAAAAAFEAATAHVVNRPDGIRQRAQNAATISAAAAAALGAFGGLSGLGHRSDPVKLLLLLALLAWLRSMSLYIAAIGYSHADSMKRADESKDPEPTTDVNTLLEHFEDYASCMRGLVRRGIRATRVAVVLTAGAVGGLFLGPILESKQAIRLTLTNQTGAAIMSACSAAESKSVKGRTGKKDPKPRSSTAPVVVAAKVRPEDLGKAVVTLHCRRSTVRVRRSSILASRVEHDP